MSDLKPSSARVRRATRAVEAFRSAAECIGPIERDCSVFAITRGQFSMIDAVLHVLDATGPARVSVWTWAIAEFEVDSMRRLARDGRLVGETLLVMDGRRTRMTGYSQAIEAEWRSSFGPTSIRLCHNHAKIATVEGGGLRVLLRGSMNLNENPRFEQLDVSEGGPAFDLVRQIEAELPVLSAPSNADLTAATRLDEAHSPESLDLFGLRDAARFGGGIKTWGK